ncbi:MAG TPA: hypothetical protein VFS96_08790 [Nitrolancea sp.]|nr:hypothetical protein [Nitrolancea sp.]
MFGNNDATTVIVHRGVLVRGPSTAEYYTSQPAPTQWLAVGLVSTHPATRECPRLQQFLVGTGRTEDSAVSALWDRLASPTPGSQPRPQRDPYLSASDLIEMVENSIGGMANEGLEAMEPVSIRYTLR